METQCWANVPRTLLDRAHEEAQRKRFDTTPLGLIREAGSRNDGFAAEYIRRFNGVDLAEARQAYEEGRRQLA